MASDRKSRKLARRIQKRSNAKTMRDNRAMALGFGFIAIFIILILRVLYIQTVPGPEYRRLATRQQNRTQLSSVNRNVPATRGAILDRHMQPLIGTIPVFEVFIDVNLLHAAGNATINEHIEAINRHLGIPSMTLLAHFEVDPTTGDLRNPVGASHRVIAREVEPEAALYLRDNYRHVHATQMSMRQHYDPFFAPQVLGFMRGDAVMGLESSYNAALTGVPGRTIMVNGELEEIPVRNGFTLITTLDSDIQHIAQNIVNQTYAEMDADFVGLIAVDPFTGEVLAMAQAPTFSIADPLDVNLTNDTWLQENWDLLTERERTEQMERMWQNFHISRAYEPGSIFKPIVIAAAIEEGTINPNRTFNCQGGRQVREDWVACWTIHHGLTLTEAIYRSCNVAMFYVMDTLQRDNFYRYRGYFGFGTRTGIDLPAETAVSSRLVMYTREALGPVELLTSSIGQGFNATSMQSIMAYAALINGGDMLQPFVVSQVVDEFNNVVHENHPTVLRRVISGSTSDFIRRQMEYVVSAEAGTARSARITGHAVGGKTGTGQQGRRDAGINSLSFLAFTPVENPEILVMMVIDRVCNDTYGGAGAELGHRTARFLREVIALRGMPPSDGPYALDYWRPSETIAEPMPDYSGWRLADAVNDLSSRSNSGYQVVGSGTVVSHTFPVPGRDLPQTSPVLFHMDPETRISEEMVLVPDVIGMTVSEANSVLRSFGLPPVLLESFTHVSQFSMGEPRTMNVEPRDEGSGPYIPDMPIDPTSGMRVYRQYPSASSELERGTTVMLRAR